MAEAEVVSLSGAPIYTRGVPASDVVEMLEGALELARRGEIHGAHMVLVHDDGVARKARCGRVNYSVLGCLAFLSHELIREGFNQP